MDTLLEVDGLSVGFDTDDGRVEAVDRVGFSVARGETVGIVGESGCGKSVTALSIMRLLPQPMGKVLGGRILFKGRDLLEASAEEMHSIRGNEIGMVFQEPMTALNPVQRIGKQLSECFLLHYPGITKKEAWNRSIEALKRVGIPSPEIRVSEYPHQLSGGMRQRVVIAIALACDPDLLICDEPTTALDVTVQAQILDLIKSLQAELGMSVIMITHDMGVIAETCDSMVVMYACRVAERGPIKTLFANPKHRYTRGLLDSIPVLDSPHKQKLNTIDGTVPGLREMPVGARFAARSTHCDVSSYLNSKEYQTVRPDLIEIEPGHWVEDCEVIRV